MQWNFWWNRKIAHKNRAKMKFYIFGKAVCVCVYGLAICCWWTRHQGWPGSSLHMPLHPQVGWQATLMTLDGTQTLVASRMTELDSRGASERDLVLLLGNSGKLDLEKDRDDEGVALKKGGDQTIGEQWERHLFCWWSVWRLDENFEVYRQQQLIRVLMTRHELFRWWFEWS